MKRYELHLLGSPRLSVDGEPRPITAAKALALLAFLALADGPVPRERVLGLLWGESAEDAARKNLRNLLWSLRRAAGEQLIEGNEARLALGPEVWSDVGAVYHSTPQDSSEALSAALEWYQGPLLDGVVLSEAPDFELWLSTARETLLLHTVTLGVEAAERAKAGSRWDEVLALGQRVLVLEPLNEPAQRLTMEALAASGRRAEALRHGESFQGSLQAEYGVRAAAATLALEKAIRNDTVAVGKTATQYRQRPPESEAPYVGRETELTAFDRSYATMLERQGFRALILTGDLGIGKTRLWREWVSRHRPPPHVAATQASASTQGLPLSPIIELLRGPLSHILRNEDVLAPVWRAELARLFPEIRDVTPQLLSPPRMEAGEERRRIFEALVASVRAAAREPMVLVLDDAQWSDDLTLSWLGYLPQRVADLPVLAVLAYRTAEASPALTRLIADWGRTQAATAIRLQPLTLEQSRKYVAELGMPAGEPIVDQGAGNPYYLRELARASGLSLPGGLPPALKDVIQLLLSRLSGAASHLLLAIAVAEPHANALVLQRVAGLSEDEFLDSLDELLTAEFVTEETPGTLSLHQTDGMIGSLSRPAEYRIAQPLVKSVLLGGTSNARRASLRRRVAEALEATAGPRLPELAAYLSEDFAVAGDNERAAKYADLAAQRLMTLATPLEAVYLLRRAQAWSPTPERLLRLSDALLPAGDPTAARSVLQESLDIFLSTGDVEGAARACLAMANTYLGSGSGADVTRWAKRGLQLLASPSPALAAEAHFLLGAGGARSGSDPSDAFSELEEASRLAEENSLDLLAAHALFETGTLLAQQGNLTEAILRYRSSVIQADRAHDELQVVLGLNNLAYHLMLADRIEEAQETIDRALALDEHSALRLPRPYLYSTRGEIALAKSELEDAADWFERALAEAREQKLVEQEAVCLANQGLTARALGALDDALLRLEKACEVASQGSSAFLRARLGIWLGQIHYERGEMRAAREELDQIDALTKAGGFKGLASEATTLRQRLSVG
jgi:DNA-binding SARP family transcriptional activator